MIGYVTLGSNDVARAARFYDDLLAGVGAKRIMDYGTFIVWGPSIDKGSLAITEPYDKKPATVGNGVTVGFAVGRPDKVHEMHAKALILGATDEGAPGSRGDGWYCGYVRDLDGHKLNFFCMVPETK
jgi:catechol 2,3-dioxygenase-like lactoylglutathione lyase family enzyme